MATTGIFTDLYSILDPGLDRNTNFDEVISTMPHERFILTSVKGKVALGGKNLFNKSLLVKFLFVGCKGRADLPATLAS